MDSFIGGGPDTGSATHQGTLLSNHYGPGNFLDVLSGPRNFYEATHEGAGTIIGSNNGDTYIYASNDNGGGGTGREAVFVA